MRGAFISMKTYTFEVHIATSSNLKDLYSDKITVKACSYEIAVDKLIAAAQVIHKDICEIFIDRFSIKVK